MFQDIGKHALRMIFITQSQDEYLSSGSCGMTRRITAVAISWISLAAPLRHPCQKRSAVGGGVEGGDVLGGTRYAWPPGAPRPGLAQLRSLGISQTSLLHLQASLAILFWEDVVITILLFLMTQSVNKVYLEASSHLRFRVSDVCCLCVK